MQTAVLIVDVQRALVEGEHAVPGAVDLLERLSSLLRRAREAGVPVVHVQDHGEGPTREGTPGWQLVLPVRSGEPVVSKHHDDAFDGTGLADLLVGVDRVVIVGIQSEMCVAATARAAMRRGLHVVLPRGGHATYDVPADRDAPGVPAALVARVAEWSLGDTVEVPGDVDSVDLGAAG